MIAKGGNVVSRTDLANNKYSSADPRLVMFNTIAAKGQTPFALKFGQTFNDPQGPWLVLLRDAVFGDASKIDADNDAINASLQPVAGRRRGAACQPARATLDTPTLRRNRGRQGSRSPPPRRRRRGWPRLAAHRGSSLGNRAMRAPDGHLRGASSSSSRCSWSSGCRLGNWPLLGGDKGLNFPKNYTAIVQQHAVLAGGRASRSNTPSSSPSC